MAGKPFNPFDDQEDSMEFVPGGEQEEAPEANPQANHATHIKQIPLERPKRKSNLKIDFEELSDQGTDTRGAVKIGAEKLPAGEFLTGIKKRDFDAALDKARASQNSSAVASVQADATVRKVRLPLYLLAFGMVLFVGMLVGGFYGYKTYLENQEAARQKALEELRPRKH